MFRVNAAEAAQDGRIHIEKINAPFLFRESAQRRRNVALGADLFALESEQLRFRYHLWNAGRGNYLPRASHAARILTHAPRCLTTKSEDGAFRHFSQLA